ncbi:VWA domain-containing protein [Halovivax sp.]|uniref:vWA domain-containing protein n=1 Tax=Halovivax sp. TaxID=1935978 RepID=UPI0025C1C33E|nr:VWA domain-containing protein [Halovivax sp.]
MTPSRRHFLTVSAGATLLAGCTSVPRPDRSSDDELVDDWQYEPDGDDGGSFAPPVQFGGTDGAVDEDVADVADDAAMAAESDEAIGLAAGGAADVSTFRRNVAEGYLPIPETIAYEGLFHEYYFDTGGDGSCDSLFCPTYTPATSPDPLSGDRERYLSVGLDSGLAQSEFERPPLNLVVVLDVSGSMSASFDDYYYGQYGGRYYYDEHGNKQELEEENDRPKMEVAKEALVTLTRHLRPEDRLGIVLFESEAHVAKPLRAVETTDMDAIRGHIREDVQAGGGTNISAAMAAAEDLVDEYDDLRQDEYETRSIMLTDAQINWGETDADELRSSLEANAESDHHTSVVGIGVDFNADLIDQLTSVKGANYYSVYTESEFERRMDEQFEYMVTPLVYDLSLELHAEDAEIVRVYGSGADDSADGELMHVHTLFPSPREDGEAKGGVVLVQVDAAAAEDLELEASWETRYGESESSTETVSFPPGDEVYGNDAVRKATLLARYGDLLKRWSVHERAAAGEDAARDEIDPADRDVDADDPIEPPVTETASEWELQSHPLSVSEPYDERFRALRKHLADEMDAVGDETLTREVELIDDILETAEGLE